MTADPEGGDAVLNHYRLQAEEHGHEPTSTMADRTTRAREFDAVLACLDLVLPPGGAGAEVLEVGCGNGLLLGMIAARYPDATLVGTDWSPDMVALTADRQVPGSTVQREDVRALSFADGRFAAVVSERCLVNLLDPEEQDQALVELHRVLAPGGHLVLIEAYADGLANLNVARDEVGLPPNVTPFHNLWFDPDRVAATLRGRFDLVEHESVPPPNFLSSHYFVSRVLYPAVTRAEIRYNTAFVEFFGFLPARGDFSPIRLHLLRKR
ncbi:MAG: class I SAM-dependent methyltransferase [Acidimicrobiia bacterium]|jgi:SAM-dependent methyltransferase|nr:class I SAM-dependent methyltransferase [Acidimicrobiia bacterium]